MLWQEVKEREMGLGDLARRHIKDGVGLGGGVGDLVWIYVL